MNSIERRDQPAVRVRDLRVVRGNRLVLPGISFDLPRGVLVGLLGPSGCGKTTLMRAIMGIQIIKAGTVEVLGLPAGAKPLRSRIGYQTQARSVYYDLTVRENLTYFSRVLGAPALDVDRVIDKVDLRSHADELVVNLSGGQEARVSLAVALLGEPDLLILDEPTVGLDPVLRRDLWELFGRLAKSGATLLVSSHVMDEAVRCDRLLLMRDGRLLHTGSPDELLERTGRRDPESAFLALVEADQLRERTGVT
jgi:ABC-2 type transport system ATP-binding protein